MFLLKHSCLPRAASTAFVDWETRTKVAKVNVGSKADGAICYLGPSASRANYGELTWLLGLGWKRGPDRLVTSSRGRVVSFQILEVDCAGSFHPVASNTAVESSRTWWE